MKKVLWILLCIMIIITFLQIIDIYALYRSEISGKFTTATGKWVIKVNDVLVTGFASNSFNITEDDMMFLDTDVVKDNLIAPNVGMYFELEIDPTGTEVAVKYDVSVKDISDVILNESLVEADFIDLEVTNIEQTRTYSDGSTTTSSGKIINLANQNIKNVIPLTDINAGCKDTIKIYFKWKNNEAYNEDESELASAGNAILKIPVEAKFTQYMGEEL